MQADQLLLWLDLLPSVDSRFGRVCRAQGLLCDNRWCELDWALYYARANLQASTGLTIFGLQCQLADPGALPLVALPIPEANSDCLQGVLADVTSLHQTNDNGASTSATAGAGNGIEAQGTEGVSGAAVQTVVPAAIAVPVAVPLAEPTSVALASAVQSGPVQAAPSAAVASGAAAAGANASASTPRPLPAPLSLNVYPPFNGIERLQQELQAFRHAWCALSVMVSVAISCG